MIQNTAAGGDILALVAQNNNPGTETNFISFKDNGGDSYSAIEGTGSGVNLLSSGSDYAEWVPAKSESDIFESGDVVGVYNGRVSAMTTGAQHVLVTTRNPTVVGGYPFDQRDDEVRVILPDGTRRYTSGAVVAMLGRTPTKVRGPVNAGDYIIPSGNNDRTGIAVPPAKLTIKHLSSILGRAWESSEDSGVKLVEVAVHFQPSTPLAEMTMMIARRDQETAVVEERVSEMEKTIRRLEELLAVRLELEAAKSLAKAE